MAKKRLIKNKERKVFKMLKKVVFYENWKALISDWNFSDWKGIGYHIERINKEGFLRAIDFNFVVYQNLFYLFHYSDKFFLVEDIGFTDFYIVYLNDDMAYPKAFFSYDEALDFLEKELAKVSK